MLFKAYDANKFGVKEQVLALIYLFVINCNRNASFKTGTTG